MKTSTARVAFVAALLGTIPTLASAAVNPKNANFYLPFTDLSCANPGFALEVERSYNSRSTSNGPLGFGWTFNYDTEVGTDDFGNVAIRESDGFVAKFVSEGDKASSPKEAAVNKYMKLRRDADKAKRREKDSRYYTRLKQKLMTNPELFQKARAQFPQMANQELPQGRYVSTSRGLQVLRVGKDNYIRTFPNGIRHVFYKSGRLRKIVDAVGHSLTIRYEKGDTGNIKEVIHSDGSRLKFELNARGKIKKVSGCGREVSYQYDDKDNMIASMDTKGKVTKYEYDDLHNMTGVTYPNGDRVENKYNVKKDWLLQQSGPGAFKSSYQYGSDKDDPSHYWTVIREGADVTRYDYFDNEDKVVIVDPAGRKTEKVFSKCCGKPLRVRTPDGRTTKYKYDSRGNVTQITDSTGMSVVYTYHPKFNKVSKVKTPVGETNYAYDNQGQLIRGKTANGTVVHLKYSKSGRVAMLSDGKGKKYEFKYNDAGRPIRIMPSGAKGAVVIDYADDGAVSAVRSIGKGVDYRATLAELQFLMKIIEPAYRFEL